MLQLCGVQPCSDHLKKGIIELEKIQKMIRISFTWWVTVSPGILWAWKRDNLSSIKPWASQRWWTQASSPCLPRDDLRVVLMIYQPAGSKLSNESGSSCDGDINFATKTLFRCEEQSSLFLLPLSSLLLWTLYKRLSCELIATSWLAGVISLE